MKRTLSGTVFLTILGPVFGLYVFFVPLSEAFYERKDENSSLDVRGSVQSLGTFSKNPGDELLISEDTSLSGGAIARLLVLAELGEYTGFEFNGFQYYTKSVFPGLGSQGSVPTDTERTSVLEWSQRDDSYAQARLGIDRLSARFSADRLDLRVGRQPVNLATVFYFTPNDFFAPFAPNSFFRLYKPGVDAGRADLRLGELSQFSFISVLGYRPDASESNGWSREPRLGRSSLLGRFLIPGFGFEWGILGGSVKEQSLAGGSLQGELLNGLGVRAEGHFVWSGPGLSDETGKIAVNLEHRFQNGVTARMEQFYNSRGYHSTAELNNQMIAGILPGFFLARHYTAIGFDYEFTPLLSAEALSISNWVDPSFLFSLNSVYSLSDEGDLVLGLDLPAGERASGTTLESEFGTLPFSFFIEIRYFF